MCSGLGILHLLSRYMVKKTIFGLLIKSYIKRCFRTSFKRRQIERIYVFVLVVFSDGVYNDAVNIPH